MLKRISTLVSSVKEKVSRRGTLPVPLSKSEPDTTESSSSTKSVSLFRQKALDAQHVSWLGDIVLVRPTSFTFLTIVALCMGLVIVLFLFFGSYTKRATVTGQLVPAEGQVKVIVPQPGIVLEKFVKEGQEVKRGDRLFTVSSERYNSDGSGVQANISNQMRSQRDSLKEQVTKLIQLQANERDSLTSKIASVRSELDSLSEQHKSQQRLVQIAEDATNRYSKLLDQGYISMQQLQQRQVELLGQRQTLQGLERERASLQQKLTESLNELDGLHDRQANQRAEVERQLSSVEQQLAENEAKRTLAITAPETGIATAVLAEVGQSVDNTRPLLSIVPVDSQLQAELYAPSRSIGFIRDGDEVLIRYQPYPYQKFGQYHGKVQSISKTSIPATQLANMVGSVPGLGQDGEQVYRLRVRLDDQAVLAYGKPYPLQTGMLLEADILQEKRHLYEWVLEPLYSLTGKL